MTFDILLTIIINLKKTSYEKPIIIFLALLGVVFLTSMIMVDESARSPRKDGKVSKPISSEVMKIAEKSCVKCHTEGGDKKAMMRLNLSNWNEFSPGKQACKAKKMCKMVSNGKMPPKGYQEKHPDAVPTKDDIGIICDWANSYHK